MLKKPLLIAAVAATLAAALPTQSSASGDPVLGALVGAGIGAAIGHHVDGRNGAWVGGALGALTGASIAANSGGYYDGRYAGPPDAYYPSAPGYYGPPTPYYEPAPVYSGPPAVVYAPRPVYGRSYPVYVRSYQPRPPNDGRNDWRDDRGARNRDGYDRRGR